MATPAAYLHAVVEADTKKASGQLRLFEQDLKRTDKAATSTSKSVSQFGRDTDRASKPVDRLSGRMANLNMSFMSVRNVMGLLKFPAMASAIAPAAQGVNALTAGATALTGSLLPLAGAATGAGAALGALGQAKAVIAISGLKGVTDAVGGLNEEMDKSADAYKNLTPQMERFAGTLERSKKPLLDIQKSVQKPLFAGMNEGIQLASKNLPALKTVLTSTAGSLGFLAHEAGQFAGRSGFGRDFEKIGLTNGMVLRQMGQAGLNVADAFRHVMVVARPLVQWMGRMVLQFSEYVSASAKAGRKSGDLRKFFNETKDILKVIVPMIGNFAKGLWNVLRIGSGLGDKMWKSLGDSAKEFRKWTESAKGKNTIEQWFKDAKKPLWEMGKLIRDIGEAFFDLGSGGKGVTGLIRTVRKDLLPVFVDLAKASKGFGPVLLDFIKEALPLLGQLAGPNGALTLMVKGFTQVSKWLSDIIDLVPGLGPMVSSLLTMGALSKILGGRMLGLKSIFEGVVDVSKWGFGVMTDGFDALKTRFPGIQRGLAAVKDKFETLALHAMEWKDKAVSAASNWISGFRTKMGNGIRRVRDMATSIMKRAQMWVSSAASAVGEFVGGMVTKFKGSKLGQKLIPFFKRIAIRIGKVIAATVAAATLFGEGAATGLATLFNKGVQKLGPAWTAIGKSVGMRVGGGILLGISAAFALYEGYKAAKDTFTNIPFALRAGSGAAGGGTAPSGPEGKGLPPDRGPTLYIDDQGRYHEGSPHGPLAGAGRGGGGKGKKGGQFGGLVTPGGIAGFQRGGMVGPGPRDTVNAMLEPGELVIPKKAVKDAKERSKLAGKVVSSELGKGQKDALKGTREFAKGHDKQMVGLQKDTEKQSEKTRDKTTDDFKKLTKNAKKAAKDMQTGVVSSFKSMTKASTDAMLDLETQVNKALRALGVKGVSFGVSTGSDNGGGGKGKGMQRGGKVGGTGVGDKIPHWLEPGEYVLNKKLTRAIGRPMLDMWNSDMVPRMASGGLVQALGPYDIPPIQYDPNHAGGNSHLHLAMSSVAGAKALAKRIAPMGWTASEAPWAGGVAPIHQDPGHYTGSSFDANAADEGRSAVAAVARILGGKGGGGAMVAKLKKIMLKGPNGPLKSMGQASVDKVYKAARSYLAKKAPTEGVEGMSGSGPVEKAFAKVAKKLSASKTATEALGMAGYAESGMRDLPGGDATSQGALQLLASTAAGMGIDPHDEQAVASAFLLKGFYGRGGANKLAGQGLPSHLVAQGVQGSAFASGSNYLAQKGAARGWMSRYGLQKGGMPKLAEGGRVRSSGLAHVDRGDVHRGTKIELIVKGDAAAFALERADQVYAMIDGERVEVEGFEKRKHRRRRS